MPRLRYIEDSEKTPQSRRHDRKRQEDRRARSARGLHHDAQRGRQRLGRVWNKVLYEGVLPHKLKEMCRIKISVAHQCGYCSTVRSNVAKAEGLTEEMIDDLADYPRATGSARARRRRCTMPSCSSRASTPSTRTRSTSELQQHFSDEEIIELGMLCAQTDGVGKLVKSLNVVSWEEACALNPSLAQGADRAQRLPSGQRCRSGTCH